MQPTKTLTFGEAQRLNRHDRRKLGKINKIKISGTSKPIISDKR